MIDYGLLQKSLDFYEEKGFVRIESPWTVSENISNLTKPKDVINFKLKHNNKCLVASGEQSFLSLINKGFLPNGKYQTCTPCFRSDEFSVTHTKYFIKNELIITDDVNLKSLNKIVDTAYEFFQSIIENKDGLLAIVETSSGFDINYNNFELGSYGIRDLGFIKYIYGTGLAEPRFSRVVNKKI